MIKIHLCLQNELSVALDADPGTFECCQPKPNARSPMILGAGSDHCEDFRTSLISHFQLFPSRRDKVGKG